MHAKKEDLVLVRGLADEERDLLEREVSCECHGDGGFMTDVFALETVMECSPKSAAGKLCAAVLRMVQLTSKDHDGLVYFPC